jgi:hypothetical protein
VDGPLRLVEVLQPAADDDQVDVGAHRPEAVLGHGWPRAMARLRLHQVPPLVVAVVSGTWVVVVVSIGTVVTTEVSVGSVDGSLGGGSLLGAAVVSTGSGALVAGGAVVSTGAAVDATVAAGSSAPASPVPATDDVDGAAPPDSSSPGVDWASAGVAPMVAARSMGAADSASTAMATTRPTYVERPTKPAVVRALRAGCVLLNNMAPEIVRRREGCPDPFDVGS